MKKEKREILSIVAMTVYVAAITSINPIIQTMIEEFPSVDASVVRMASTISALTAAFTLVIVGSVAGKQISFRAIVGTGLLLIFVGGCAPMIWNRTIYVILAARFVFGIGLGCINVRNAVIIRSFDPARQTKLLGLSMFVSCLCNTAIVELTGLIGEYDWKLSFIVYAPALILMLLFMRSYEEPPRITEKKAAARSDRKLSPRVYIYLGLIFYVSLFKNPLVMCMSSFVKEAGLGGASESGTILLFYSLGGMVSGITYPKFVKMLRKSFVPVHFALLSVCAAGILSGAGLIVESLSTFILGYAYFSLNLAFVEYAGAVSGKQTVALATSLVAAFAHFGSFSSNYSIQLSSVLQRVFPQYSETFLTFACCVLFFAIAAVMTFIVNVKPRELAE